MYAFKFISVCLLTIFITFFALLAIVDSMFSSMGRGAAVFIILILPVSMVVGILVAKKTVKENTD